MIELPEHKAGLMIRHNDHKNVYETIEQYERGDSSDYWISEEERQKAIETDELWELQWYPETPVGFYMIYGSTLEAVLEAAKAYKET